MSQQNVESLRRGFEAWARDDTETVAMLLRDLVAPGFELDPLYLDKVYTGTDALPAMLADAREVWADYNPEVEEIVDLGEHVVTVIRIRGRGAESGVPIDQRTAILWTFDGLKAVHAKSFPSMAEARAAAGLRE